MKYKIITYGCQMNKSDSERLANQLEALGFKLSEKNPDLIVFNLCSVRQSAVDRAKARINKSRGKAKIAATGCILEKDKKEIEKITDVIFNIKYLTHLSEILQKLGFKPKKLKTKKDYLKIEPKYSSDILAYVPIMNGCNNFCSYCVVPYVRGREYSRDKQEILCEIKKLVKKGIKEIWLLGQNVNSYKPSFSDLLSEINEIEGDFWIRFTSSHPKDLTKKTIETIAKCQKVTPYFNLPIQSGDDEVLKAMNRPYTVKQYKKLIKTTRQAFKKYRKGLESIPALSTDLIVGFPNESTQQFNNTKKTIKEISFTFGYVSRYSPRPGTKAAKLKDNISPEQKKKREKQLVKIIEESALKFNKKFLNKNVNVLILKKKNNFYLGKTRHYQTIKIPVDNCNEDGPRCKPRCKFGFVKARVNKITPYGLEGKT